MDLLEPYILAGTQEAAKNIPLMYLYLQKVFIYIEYCRKPQSDEGNKKIVRRTQRGVPAQ